MQLWYEVFCANYGPHDQFGEKRKEKQVVDELFFGHKLTPVHINSITKVFESIE